MLDFFSQDDRFEKAFAFAYKLHKEQKRKGTNIPYIFHLMETASITMQYDGTLDEAIAALLHDAAEDQGEDAIIKIQEKFGDAVANIVLECSDSIGPNKLDWRPRKEKYIEQLAKASASSRLVAAADKLHNARTILSDYRKIGEEVWNRFTGLKDGTLWYYRALTDVFLKNGPLPIAEELDKVVSQIEQMVSARLTTQVQVDSVLANNAAYVELMNLTGQHAIKKFIHELVAAVKLNQERKSRGIAQADELNFHLAFTGNPGTGKTRVAELLGKIFAGLGLLSSGHIHTVERTDLVAGFIGQTAGKTKAEIDKALNGVLFIDEAYTLAREKEVTGDFGQEVIETLLNEMKDPTKRFIVIVSGYPREMEFFLNSNPGLKSRFNHTIQFSDYSPAELIEIGMNFIHRKELFIEEGAKKALFEKCVDAYRNRDKTFGNARFVKGLIDEAMMHQAARLAAMPDLKKLPQRTLLTLTEEDFSKVFQQFQSAFVRLQVDEPQLRDLLNQVHKLVSIRNVKNEINELISLVRYYNSIGRDIWKKFSLHSVFTGNPGTGKTTVARLLSQIYKSLGILERGHLVECDRSSLVAGYIGQTAIKTAALIEQAKGGILFIDEAYALTKPAENDFGAEAIETILKRMEDDRGKFGVIVAGYTEEMKYFLDANPGLRSRFDQTFFFEDFSAEEILEITRRLFRDVQLTMSTEAEAHIKAYLDSICARRDRYFGNAREARKIVQQGERNQNLRVAKMEEKDRTPHIIETVSLEDVTEFQIAPPVVKSGFGFGG